MSSPEPGLPDPLVPQASAPRAAPKPEPGLPDPLVPQASAPRAAPKPGPVLSEPVAMLVAAVTSLRSREPSSLPGPLALDETAVLLGELEKLSVLCLRRVADVQTRQLHTFAGAASTSSWVDQLHVGVNRGYVALAGKLARMPHLTEQVAQGRLSLPMAVGIGQALDRLRRHVDRPSGFIDGRPAEPVITAVIVDGVLSVLGQARGGLADDDPQLAELEHRLLDIADAPLSAIARFEQAFVLLAGQLPAGRLLDGALGQLVDALLPLELEDRSERGHRDRGLHLAPTPDGSGWTVRGELDLECGELLSTVLTASQATDPDNPADTAGWVAERAGHDDAGPAAGQHGAGPEPPPAQPEPPPARSLRQRKHDALKIALRRLLDSAALGSRDKAAPHLNVTVGLDALHDQPGALNPVAGSGIVLPRSLARRLLCGSSITRFVLGLGGRVLQVSHTERTLKAHERAALTLQWGGRCAAAGCAHPVGQPLVPHHVTPWHVSGSTSLDDSVPLCHRSHQDLHHGHRTLLLRDGRYLSPTGWTDRPREAPPDERAASWGAGAWPDRSDGPPAA